MRKYSARKNAKGIFSTLTKTIPELKTKAGQYGVSPIVLKKCVAKLNSPIWLIYRIIEVATEITEIITARIP